MFSSDFRYMLNVIKLLAWFEKLIGGVFYDTIFSLRSHPVQKLRTLRGILIMISAPIHTEENLSQENQFYKILEDFVALYLMHFKLQCNKLTKI